MSDQELICSLHKIGALQFGEFTLKSGQTSSIYINLRKIISYPDILRTVADAMWQKIKDCQFDLVCGVPYTALPIATCISLQHNLPMVMRRKEKKDYGTKQMIEGVFTTGQSCLVIEDLITTGGSIIETADELENAGLTVTNVIALINSEQGGKENLAKKYRPHTILTMSQILKTLMESNVLNPLEQKSIETFLMERSCK